MSSATPPPPPPPPPGGSNIPPAPAFNSPRPTAAFVPPPPSAPVPPTGNINVPRTPIAPSAPHVAVELGSGSSDRLSMAEVGVDALTLVLSLTAFVLLYLDLFQKTKG